MRLWVNKARTVLVSEMDDGNLTVAFRRDEDDIWGPPQLCVSEKTDQTFQTYDWHSEWHRGSRA
jgi:hypothetical protein